MAKSLTETRGEMFGSTARHPGGRAEDHVGSSHFSGWGSRAVVGKGLSLKGKPLVSHVCQPGLTFQNSSDSWGPNRQIHEAVGDTSRSDHSILLKDVLTEGPHNPVVFILKKLSYQHLVGSPQICLKLLKCGFPGILTSFIPHIILPNASSGRPLQSRR